MVRNLYTANNISFKFRYLAFCLLTFIVFFVGCVDPKLWDKAKQECPACDCTYEYDWFQPYFEEGPTEIGPDVYEFTPEEQGFQQL